VWGKEEMPCVRERNRGKNLGGVMYDIEKDVPVVLIRKSLKKYPFDSMAVGDSFKFDVKFLNRIRSSACIYSSKYKKKLVIGKISENEARCWRIK